ncbi:restriction endonuclease subunit S [Prevotellamassilia timonensis]|uniref:restriction endonuclease subunit S n=2 Tax=Prevotellamassilia timonensis TaxID=1852370 RepID=UPI00307A5114
MELKKYKLADIGKVITGKTPSTSIAENYAWGTIPFYTPEDVAKGLGMMGRNSRFISKTGFEEIASNTISGESVLVGCIGSDMGNVAYSNITCATNQQINAITQFKNGIDPLYVYYLLSTMKSYFQKIAGSTTTPILPKSIFEEIEIHLPDMKKQKDVVSILYALDRKIELNKQINDNLEAMAKQLYDYWFVQFDFPNEEGKPYKASGGAMVWNEKLKREIPQEWSNCKLKEFINLFDSKRVPLSSKDRGERQGVYPYYGATGIMDYVNDYIFDGDYILLAEDGSTSDAKGLPIVQYIWGKNWVNNHAHIILPKNERYMMFTYQMLRSIPAKQIETGSIQKKISQENLCGYKMVLPNSDLLEKYENVVSPLWEKRKRCIEEINSLTKQRDELLPLLMNGQASVNYHLSDD